MTHGWLRVWTTEQWRTRRRECDSVQVRWWGEGKERTGVPTTDSVGLYIHSTAFFRLSSPPARSRRDYSSGTPPPRSPISCANPVPPGPADSAQDQDPIEPQNVLNFLRASPQIAAEGQAFSAYAVIFSYRVIFVRSVPMHAVLLTNISRPPREHHVVPDACHIRHSPPRCLSLHTAPPHCQRPS